MTKTPTNFVLFLLMVSCVGRMVFVVKGDKSCREDLGGICGEKCKEECIKKHPDGEGSCEIVGSVPFCTCFYECPPKPPSPPKPKICNGGAGVCFAGCLDDCCNKNCAAKFNKGTGFCDRIGSAFLCQCQYECT